MPSFNLDKLESKDKTNNEEKLNSLFFFVNSGGILHLADDGGSSPEICRTGGKIKALLFYEKENAIILITSNLLLVKCVIKFNQKLNPKKVKLSISGKPEEIKCCWASEGLIAIVSGDDLVRFFYLDTDQSYIISINDHQLGDTNIEDSFTCLDFNFRKRILAMKDDLEKERDNKLKQDLTSRLAKLLMTQGDFEMAHDIYVKIGNYKKAMKCYIKMGDKNKVIEFAHNCRNPELFILAANFLQNLEWAPDVIKIIVSFYTKAKAYYNLTQFYIQLAVTVINDKKEFKKGEEYLKNALKAVMKVRENDDKKNEKIDEIKKKLDFIENLNDMNSKLQSGNAQGALQKCNELLKY